MRQENPAYNQALSGISGQYKKETGLMGYCKIKWREIIHGIDIKQGIQYTALKETFDIFLIDYVLLLHVIFSKDICNFLLLSNYSFDF
jgi:hypothetical protein